MLSSACSMRSFSSLLVLIVLPLLAYMILILNSGMEIKNVPSKCHEERLFLLMLLWCVRHLFSSESVFCVSFSLIPVAVLSRHLLWACEGLRNELVRFNTGSLCWVSSSIGQRSEVNSPWEFGGSFTNLSFAKYWKYIQD